ncbi:MAG: hypothetical protein JOZ62_01380 [Acidobacteriaceae bacterium]|nr:hypothetical protein [Acidobacteriaceae bacterium]
MATAAVLETPGDSRAATDIKTPKSQPAARNVVGEAGGRRRKRRTAKAAESTANVRYFLAKPASNGTPELDHEVGDENFAIIEALKRDGTFLILTEWRPKVDHSTKGQPVITKEPVTRK